MRNYRDHLRNQYINKLTKSKSKSEASLLDKILVWLCLFGIHGEKEETYHTFIVHIFKPL